MKPVWKDFGAVAAYAHFSGQVVAQVVDTSEGWRVWVLSRNTRGKVDFNIVGLKLSKQLAMELAERKYNDASQT